MSSNPPTLDDTTIPTPSNEWADQARAALTPDNGTQSAGTPGIDVPGAFPPEASIYPQTQSQAKPHLERAPSSGDGVKDKVHHTAENYIAAERLDQAEHFVEGVGSKAALYVPAGVASVVSNYWYGTSKPSVSNTSAGTDSGANGNSTTSHPTIKKDSAQPSSADEAGVTKLPEDRPATSEVITAAAASTAAASSATDKDASSKGNAGKAAADTSISDASSSTAGTLVPLSSRKTRRLHVPKSSSSSLSLIVFSSFVIAPVAFSSLSFFSSSFFWSSHSSHINADGRLKMFGALTLIYSVLAFVDGSAGSAGTSPTSASTSGSSAKPSAVEDAPTKTSAPAPTPAPAPAPAPAPVSEILPSSEPIAAQPAEPSITPSNTDAVKSATAAAPQEQATETSKDTISPQNANEIPEGKDDGAKKGDEKVAADVGAAGLTGLRAGVAAMGLDDKDKKDDETSQPIANLTPRRYALGSLPPVDEKGRGDAAGASEDGSVARVDGARGAWDVAQNRTAETKEVDNTGPPPKAVEDGITGNRGGDNGDGDITVDHETNKKHTDHISDLQDLVKDVAAHDASAKAPAIDVPAVTLAAPSEDSAAKPKDLRSDRGYHPAELHPYIPNASSIASGTTGASSSSQYSSLSRNTSPSTSTKEKHGHVHQRTVSTSSTGSGSPRRKKVGFFDKVRGEAKVIVGKIEHKKEKVEEGKRILHGED